ncbi:MAG: 3-hydroxyacyl-ACP dehydratase FabZ [Nitrospirae bacterium]|nr:3-hydroxyacyl-ACP dehydratase FabZ [Nitrospirota bacterium]
MIGINEIMSYLPHRYPFLLVDRIIELDKDKSITGIKNVTVNEPFFEGHFPGNPIMPGVLIIEAMAQSAGILALNSLGTTPKLVYFMSIERAKFRKPVIPGDQLILDIKVIHQRGNVWKFSGVGKVQDKVVSEAEFTAMLTEKGS